MSVERTPGAQGVGFRLSAGRCTASIGAAKHGWRNDRDTMLNRCCDITKPFRQPRRSRRGSAAGPAAASRYRSCLPGTGTGGRVRRCPGRRAGGRREPVKGDRDKPSVPSGQMPKCLTRRLAAEAGTGRSTRGSSRASESAWYTRARFAAVGGDGAGAGARCGCSVRVRENPRGETRGLFSAGPSVFPAKSRDHKRQFRWKKRFFEISRWGSDPNFNISLMKSVSRASKSRSSAGIRMFFEKKMLRRYFLRS